MVKNFSRSGLLIDGLMVVFLALLFWFLAGKLTVVRTPGHGDQSMYLELAANIHDGDGFVTDQLSPFRPTKEISHPESVRQPLLPMLLSLSASRDFSFFLRARWWVWGISLTALVALYIVISLIWGRPAGFLAAALLGLNIHFHTYASEVWCENLLILWTTLAALLIHQYFKSEKWRPALSYLIFAAIATVLAYLSKASAGAVVISFTVVCLLRLARDLRRRSSNDVIYSRSIAPLSRFLLTFLIFISPYMIYNLFKSGTLLGNADLQAAMWVEHGVLYYLPHESPPNLFSLLQDKPWYYLFARMGKGIWLQVGNHLHTLKVTPFSSTQIPSAILLVAALYHLMNYSLSAWRKFVLILLSFNALVGAWYYVIDVTPRFILVGLPLLYIHAALGMIAFFNWLIQKADWNKSKVLRRTHLLIYILPMMFLLLTLWQGRQLLNAKPLPLLGQEKEMIYFLRGKTNPDDIILLGPSHRLPWSYIFKRRYIFVPYYDNWDNLFTYIDHFDARYFLLDTEVYYRRKELLKDYIDFDKQRGLSIKKSLPRMVPLQVSRPPYLFILFRIEPPSPEQSTTTPENSPVSGP